MRMEVVNRIESVIKELWPSADVSTCPGSQVLRVIPQPAGWRTCGDLSFRVLGHAYVHL